MKKLLALLLAMAMLFAFAACGSGSDDDDDDNSKTLSKIASVNSDEDEDEDGDKKEEDTKSEITVSIPDTSSSVTNQIDAFIDANKDVYESIMESFEGMLELEIYASGSSMVYSYKYVNDIGDIDTVKEALDAAYDGNKSAMLSDLSALQSAVPKAESIIVKYLTKDGTVITTQEYK